MQHRSTNTSRAPVVSSACLALLIGGCLPSRGPIDLREADTHVVRFGVEAPRGAICPGEPVGLDIELTADVGSHLVRLVRHRRELDDAIFDIRQLRFASAQGRFDVEGRFFPDPDPLVSARTGFVFFVDVPRGPTFSVRYPPVYECATPFGREGRAGGDGAKGDDALIEDSDVATAAGTKNPMATGLGGGDGGPGGDGPDFTLYVTWVQTPDYTKLLAARAEGDVQGLTLRAPGSELDVVARGGAGGAGGQGGQGASGLIHQYLSKKHGTPIRSERGDGGNGGPGGTGGLGGHGGSIRIVLDERFDDLASSVHADARGGAGGAGGRGGRAGESGPHGATAAGRPGMPGAAGHDGPSGDRGTVTTERGDVRSHFEDLGAIVPL